MSEKDVEIVRRVFDRWARGDFSEGHAFHPDVEFELVDWPEPARTRGLDAMRRAWMATLSAWDDFRAVPYDFIETPNTLWSAIASSHAVRAAERT